MTAPQRRPKSQIAVGRLTREPERIHFDVFAPFLAELRDKVAKVVAFEVDPSGKIVCKPRP